MKKLFASHNRSDKFRMVAMQIINEEEKKKCVVLADSLRKTLEAASTRRGTDPRIGNGAGTNNPPLHLPQQERATSEHR
jgi:hypothetical protein